MFEEVIGAADADAAFNGLEADIVYVRRLDFLVANQSVAYSPNVCRGGSRPT